MTPESLLEVLDAAHLSYSVDGPFPQRGGIMLVGPPGVMKSTFLETAFSDYPNALVLSDLNVTQLIQLRDDLLSGRYRTIAFLAFEKLYARAARTSANIEAHLCALVEEGFTRASFEDQRMATMKARSLVCAAMPYTFYANQFKAWADGGFARRFLWCTIRLKDPEKIGEAIHNWERIAFASARPRVPKVRLPMSLTENESRLCQRYVREQPGSASPFVLLKKIAMVLKWKYEKDDPKRPWKILADFAPALTKNGADIEL